MLYDFIHRLSIETRATAVSLPDAGRSTKAFEDEFSKRKTVKAVMINFPFSRNIINIIYISNRAFAQPPAIYPNNLVVSLKI